MGSSFKNTVPYDDDAPDIVQDVLHFLECDDIPSMKYLEVSTVVCLCLCYTKLTAKLTFQDIDSYLPKLQQAYIERIKASGGRLPAWLPSNLAITDPEEVAMNEAKANLELISNADLNSVIRTSLCTLNDKLRSNVVKRFSEGQLRFSLDQILSVMFQKALPKTERQSSKVDIVWV